MAYARKKTKSFTRIDSIAQRRKLQLFYMAASAAKKRGQPEKEAMFRRRITLLRNKIKGGLDLGRG